MNTTIEHSTDALKQRLREQLTEDLTAVNAVLNQQMRNSSGFISDVLEHVSHFRGKQIRPMLLLLTHRSIAGSCDNSSRTLAAVVEMIHTATLVHDDVIDESEKRRHVATVHRRWNAKTSVLLGDFLFSKAFHLAASTGDAEACRLIGLATDRTCEGELNQMAASLDQSTSEPDYFRIIRGKTGQLFALSCLLGARSAGGTKVQHQAAVNFGMRLGLAFQIVDDIIDLQESEATTGKDSANDLHNQRLTLPLIRALKGGTAQESATLLQWVRDTGEADMDAVRRHPRIAAGISSAFETAQQLIDRSLRNLLALPDGTDRSLLQSIASAAVHRNR